MKNWTHDIIEELRDNYSETTTELNNFVVNKLGIKVDSIIKAKKIKEILQDYSLKGYLTWKAGKEVKDTQGSFVDYDWDEEPKGIPIGYDEEEFDGFKGFRKYFATNKNGVEQTFINNRIEAKLTIEGLDYAIELKRERQKHRFLQITTPLTTGFACLAAIMSVLNYYKKSDIPPLQPPQVILLPQSQTITPKKEDTSSKTSQYLPQSHGKSILSH